MAWGALTITLREGLRVNPLEEREQRLLLGECHLPTKKRTPPVCHNLLHDPKIFQLLYRVDESLAEEARTTRCACGGKWHRADYPRKPRGRLRDFRMQYASRFSFCCSHCRKRRTSPSVRFFGRRVYLALVILLMAGRLTARTPGAGEKTLASLRHLCRYISYMATYPENHMPSLAGKRRFGTVGSEVLFAQDSAESRRLQRAAAQGRTHPESPHPVQQTNGLAER